MRPILASLLASLLPLAAAAQTPPRTASPSEARAAGQPPRVVIGAPGRCEMRVDDGARPCTSGLVYVQNANGSILVSVQSGPGVTIGLQGDSDRQIRPENYVLNLTRMHTSINGQSAAKDVQGTCEIAMSADGRTWHNATCRATDRSGSVTTVTFTGDGRPVTAARPGQASGAPAQGGPDRAGPDAPRPAPAAPQGPGKG